MPAAFVDAPEVNLVLNHLRRNNMSKTKKKTVVKVKVPRTRNLIAKALCSGRQFQSRPFVNRKKMPAKFDWRKEIG